MPDFEIATTSILRDRCLKQFLESVKYEGFNGTVHLVDQNKREKLPDELDILPNLNYINVPFDIGVSRARNIAIDKVSSDYLFLFDDDVKFNYEVANRLKEKLENNDKLGWVSPIYYDMSKNVMQKACVDLTVEDDILVKKEVDKSQGSGLHIVDQPGVVGMYDMDLFSDLRWDNRFKVGREHVDFALRLKDTDWKAGVNFSLSLDHRGCKTPRKYRKLRNRTEEQDKILKEKHNLRKIVDNE